MLSITTRKKENSVFSFIIYVCVEGRLTKQARFYVFMGDHTLDEYEGVSPALHSQWVDFDFR